LSETVFERKVNTADNARLDISARQGCGTLVNMKWLRLRSSLFS